MLLQEFSCFQQISYDRDHTRVDESGFQIEVDCSSIKSHLHFLLIQLVVYCKMDRKVENAGYLLFLLYIDNFQKGCHQNYDAFCDFLRNLDSLSTGKGSEDPQGHGRQRYFDFWVKKRQNVFFKII